MTKLNYLETFTFPDIPGQSYPVYAVGRGGKIVNFKAIIYPNRTSCKKFTRNKQLKKRSLQAKIFDALINVGYFDPLIVYREFPVIIENSKRLPEMKSGLFWLLDYYFPELRLAVELDSDLHNEDKDSVRDEYLKRNLGISVYRLKNFNLEVTQKGEFKNLTKMMREMVPIKNPPQHIFTTDLLDKMKITPP